mgnify:CR=1 FL=1
MRYDLDEYVAARIRMDRVACPCDNDFCTGKFLDPQIRPRTQRLLKPPGALCRGYEPPGRS